jgi:hypothetical protein
VPVPLVVPVPDALDWLPHPPDVRTRLASAQPSDKARHLGLN